MTDNSRSTIRDEAVDIAKGIGIIFVIGGHCAFEVPNFPAYSFHMPLFYFISGFFLCRYICGKIGSLEFIKRKFSTLLIPYFWYNLLFGLITFILILSGINVQGNNFTNDPSIIDIINLRTLLIQPFIDGHQFMISCPLWFVPSLFLVMLLVCLTHKIYYKVINNKLAIIITILIFVLIYYFCCNTTIHQNVLLGVIFRTVIGYIFCILGLFYYKFRYIFKPLPTLFISISIYSLLAGYYGPFSYSSLGNAYMTGVQRYVSFPVIVSGIFIIISISNIIVSSNKFINKEGLILLGKNTFHIMAVHLSFFLLLNIFILLIKPGGNLGQINGIYYRLPNINYLYFFFSLCGSYYYIVFINKYRNSLDPLRILNILRKDIAIINNQSF